MYTYWEDGFHHNKNCGGEASELETNSSILFMSHFSKQRTQVPQREVLSP